MINSVVLSPSRKDEELDASLSKFEIRNRLQTLLLIRHGATLSERALVDHEIAILRFNFKGRHYDN